MTVARRTSASVALSVCALLLLSSCTPATFVWGYVGHGSDVRFGFCDSSVVTMLRLSVSERRQSGLVEVQSAVWSGPRIALPEGAIVASNALPDGWQKTEDIDLDGSWERIDVALHDGDQYVGFAILSNDDVGTDRWALSPGPGLLAGTTSCTSPFDQVFVEQPSLVADSTLAAVGEAESIAMMEDEFWAYISLIDLRSEGGSLNELEDALASLPTEQVTAFHAQLMLQYFALDTARVWNESERRRLDDYSFDSDSAASFVEMRSATIALGRESVEAALAGVAYPEPTTVPAGQGLPSVAVSRNPVTLSPEMGKNPDGW